MSPLFFKNKIILMAEKHSLGWQILLTYRHREFIWKIIPGSQREGKVAKGGKQQCVGELPWTTGDLSDYGSTP